MCQKPSFSCAEGLQRGFRAGRTELRGRQIAGEKHKPVKLPCCPSPILFFQCPLGARRSPNWLHHPRQGSSHQQCTPGVGGTGGRVTRKPALLIFLSRPVVDRPGQKVLTRCRGQTWTGGDMPRLGLGQGRHALPKAIPRETRLGQGWATGDMPLPSLGQRRHAVAKAGQDCAMGDIDGKDQSNLVLLRRHAAEPS